MKNINTTYISYKSKCKFDGTKCNLNQKWKSDCAGMSAKI